MEKCRIICCPLWAALIVLGVFTCFASSASVISSNSSLISTDTTSSKNLTSEELELRLNEYKAGAGFLIICTFLLMGDYNLGYNEIQGSRTIPEAFEAELSTLKNRMSILEKVSYQQGKAFRMPSEEDFSKEQPPICGSSRNSADQSLNNTATYHKKVKDAINRSLQFVEAHLEKLHTIEPAFALSALKAVDDKHGGEFQKLYPITDWINEICGTFHDNREADSCHALTSIWKSRPGDWKPESIVRDYGTEFTSIGTESEVIWGRLNGECQLALLTRCEVPYVCERTLFDPTPRSQYMLTHQLLQRTLAELATCASSKDLLDPEVNNRLCAKIYKEAQLISALDTPEIMRDLFAEQIGMCGYLGYSNFLRQDWLDLILSWQSKSDYGCFLRDKKTRNKFITTDKVVKRLPTEEEKLHQLEADEDCLPHFTSVSLTALTSYWDYMEEKCKNEN